MQPATIAQIHLDNLLHNIEQIRKKVLPSKIIPVVKADAYGHGAVPVTRFLAQAGFDLFCVAKFQEAMELRESGISHPILIFGRLLPAEIPQAIKAGLRITLFGREDVEWIEKAAQGGPAHVHINVDTGMGRVGVLSELAADVLDAVLQSPHCRWEGLYSHFSTSDEKDKTYSHLQLTRFKNVISDLGQKNRTPLLLHMANSGAILNLPQSYFDAVRPGIILYGHAPSSQTSASIPLKQVMTLKTYVAHLRKMPGDYPVSYGRRWTTPHATQIAVLPVGYADGIRRALTNKGEVLIQGKRYPIVGTVTMDQTMVHVEDDPIRPGDEVIIWGESPQGSIQALEVAEKIGTIPYELTCGVSKRVTRVYTP